MILVSSAAAATATPSPKAVFNAKVRAIGTQAQHALLALPPATPTSTVADAAATAGQLQAIYQRVARRMAALTVPKLSLIHISELSSTGTCTAFV